MHFYKQLTFSFFALLIAAGSLVINVNALAANPAPTTKTTAPNAAPNAVPNANSAPQNDNSDNATTLSMPLKDIQRFATAVAQIKRYYIEPITDEKLFNYAISGMLSNLDPHSDFLDADALQDLQTTTTGKFGGIGIEVIPDNGFIKVISPIDNTPAYKVGIKPGDLIVRINNKLVKDMTLREAIDLIRGESGTTVHLTILRQGEKKPLELNVTREIIKVQTIKSELMENGYGYIRISFFQTSTKQDLYKAIKDLKQQAGGHLNGVIIDLRNNPGGLLDAAIDVSDAFLDSKHLKYGGLIVYTQGRIPSADIKAKATGTDQLNGIPMVVLINEGSASASEIVAGALQDQKRAILLGQKSFGKGSVQTVLPIDYNSAIKLTTALYYTPSGRSIQAKGIEPDIVVPDIKVPNPENEDGLISIDEADLNNHLSNGNKPDNTNPASPTSAQSAQNETNVENQNAKDETKLLHTDFQLYQALEVLKGLHASTNK